jgi:hypothetical protein
MPGANNMTGQILIAHDGFNSAGKAFEFPRRAEVIDEFRAEKDRAESYFGQLAGHCRVQAAMHSVDIETAIVPGDAVRDDHLRGDKALNLTSTAPCDVLVVK